MANNSAVLVFCVSKLELRGDENRNGLDLTGIKKREEWKNLVQKCFSSDKSFLKTLRYDFFEGPVVDRKEKRFCKQPYSKEWLI